MITLNSVVKATDQKHKYVATFSKDGKTLTVRFGAYGYGDYIKYHKQDKAVADTKRKAYIARHQVSENFNDPLTAGALSRWLLWEKPTLDEAMKAFKARFNL
jgi:hypothetical protein